MARARGFNLADTAKDSSLTDLITQLPTPAAGVRAQAPEAPSVAPEVDEAPTARQGAPEGRESVTAGAKARAERRPRVRRARAARTETLSTSVDVPREVAARVRAHHAQARLGYLQLVLLAISDNAAALATKWAEPAPAEAGELFPGLSAAVRAAESTAKEQTDRLNLTGMTPEEDQQLDALVERWNAPSRRALVSAALELAYPEQPTQRSKRK
ncbi:hypothetical protein [Gordonia malaquae]|uniref:hypothetical protein n=1 Tax=Gordonia malaquae TaxID=410332 RepID=UPI0030184FD4